MTAMAKPRLELRSLIPPFELPATDGRAVNIWQFKQKSNLVLVFIPGADCAGCTDFL